MEVSGIERLIGILKYPYIFDSNFIVYERNIIYMSKVLKKLACCSNISDNET
jgi:hypothetical protein